MARVTVEDCLEHVENRFKLVLLASKRARQLTLGTEPLVEWENDKPTVVALREIAENLVNEEMMQAALAAPAEEELEYAEDDLAAALHAEISRELSQTVSEPSATPPVKQQEETTPAMSGNSVFNSGLGTKDTPVTPTTEPQEDTSTDDNSTFLSPPKPPSEGDEGF